MTTEKESAAPEKVEIPENESAPMDKTQVQLPKYTNEELTANRFAKDLERAWNLLNKNQ